MSADGVDDDGGRAQRRCHCPEHVPEARSTRGVICRASRLRIQLHALPVSASAAWQCRIEWDPSSSLGLPAATNNGKHQQILAVLDEVYRDLRQATNSNRIGQDLSHLPEANFPDV